ncbi:30S ribosomal protein S24e [Acidianus brierleyi]|uniref:Small ribosomal subunit protein eS24 n=2 Tax=Acidianus brierleyi TaxID=41673 RepID=A0A2U9IF32_9CREN|nr:30S ribosomal protein S24e [Acidianus brierleyi]AWR94554.1 30S ribosomal protein S24e [Acidianus brierleyi]
MMSQAQQIKISDKVQGVIERDFSNKVVDRRELTIKLFHIGTGTPSRQELIKSLSQLINAPEDKIVIRKIYTSYGAGISVAKVHIYNKKEILEKYEPKHLLSRGIGKKKEGEQNASQEQKSS